MSVGKLSFERWLRNTTAVSVPAAFNKQTTGTIDSTDYTNASGLVLISKF